MSLKTDTHGVLVLTMKTLLALGLIFSLVSGVCAQVGAAPPSETLAPGTESTYNNN